MQKSKKKARANPRTKRQVFDLGSKFSKIVFLSKRKGVLGFLLRTFFLFFLLVTLFFVGIGIYYLKERPDWSEALSARTESIEKQNHHLASSIENLRPNISAVDTSFKEYRRLLYIPRRAVKNENKNSSAIDSLSIRGLVGYSNTLLEFFDEIARNASTIKGKWRNLPIVFPFADNTDFVITRPFSQDGLPCPFTGIMQPHLGIDLAAELGTPILAPADGNVVSVNERDIFWGRTIKISHANGYETFYAHLGMVAVRQGQRVQRGTKIGIVGESGWTTSPHLHYELIKNGVHLDPQAYNFASLYD